MTPGQEATVKLKKGNVPGLYQVYSDVHSSRPGKLLFLGEVEREGAEWVYRSGRVTDLIRGRTSTRSKAVAALIG